MIGIKLLKVRSLAFIIIMEKIDVWLFLKGGEIFNVPRVPSKKVRQQKKHMEYENTEWFYHNCTKYYNVFNLFSWHKLFFKNL